VQDGRPHVSQRTLNPLLAPAPALQECMHDVCGLVHADAQTHDEEDERDAVEIQIEVLDGGLDDDHDVDDARGHDECAQNVVEHQVDHGHDAAARGQQELE